MHKLHSSTFKVGLARLHSLHMRPCFLMSLQVLQILKGRSLGLRALLTSAMAVSSIFCVTLLSPSIERVLPRT